MRNLSVFKAVLATSVALVVASSVASAQEGDFTYRWHLFGSGDTDNPGNPGNPGGPGEPGGPENPNPGGPIVSEPEPEDEEPGPGDFDMAAAATASTPSFVYHCFQVTSGSGNYAYDAGFSNGVLPSWVRGIDIVPASQVDTPFTGIGQYFVVHPEAEGVTIPETSACARVAYDEYPTSGDALNVMFYGMDFETPTYSGDIYQQMSGWKGFSFTITPDDTEPPITDGLPPVIVGEASIGSGYPENAPSTEFLENGTNGAIPLSIAVTQWMPHTDGEGITAPNSLYCFNVTGGYGNFIYAFGIDVHSNTNGTTPQWGLAHTDPGIYASGQNSLLPGNTTTSNRNVCVNFWKGGNVDNIDSTFLLQVLDYPTPGTKPGFDGRASMLRASWRNFIQMGPPPCCIVGEPE